MVVVKDSAATRQRLLDAAAEEFAEHGLAGARVDRVAVHARANKQLIYAYYGSKEKLFDAVLVDRLGALVDAVPFDVADLPGYAADLHDHLQAHPQLQRLATWQRLERPAVSDFEAASYRSKIAAIAAAQKAGHLSRDFSPTGVIVLVLAAAQAWWTASPTLHHLDDTTAAATGTSHRRLRPPAAGHRDDVTRAVTALLATPSSRP